MGKYYSATSDCDVENLVVRLFLPQLWGLDLSYCCLSVQVQRYSVDLRYPLTYGSPWALVVEVDQSDGSFLLPNTVVVEGLLRESTRSSQLEVDSQSDSPVERRVTLWRCCRGYQHRWVSLRLPPCRGRAGMS